MSEAHGHGDHGGHEEKDEHKKKLGELVDFFRSKNTKKIGRHFVNLKEEVDLGAIVEKAKEETWNPHKVGAEVLKEYYKKLGYDSSHHENDESAHAKAIQYMGEQGYGEFMKNIEGKEIETAYHIMKEYHKEAFKQNAVQMKKAEIKNMDLSKRLELAKKFMEDHKDIYTDDHDPYVVAFDLANHITMRAEHIDKLKSKKGSSAKDYSEKLHELYNQNRPKEDDAHHAPAHN